MTNRIHIIGKNEAVKRLISDEHQRQFDQTVEIIDRLWAGIAVIVVSAFVLWLGWQIGTLIDKIPLPR